MNGKEALGIIYTALRLANNKKINDVQMDTPDELVLTTDDGKQYQAWVIKADQLTETDPAQNLPI